VFRRGDAKRQARSTASIIKKTTMSCMNVPSRRSEKKFLWVFENFLKVFATFRPSQLT
jgi:hypothetical protein